MSTNSFRKPFNKQLHEENDQKAKDAAKKLLKQLPAYRKLIIQENILSEFEADLMALKHSKNEQGQDVFTSESLVEVEVKVSWKDGRYPYDTVRIPARKLKFIGADWMMVRADGKAALYIPAAVVEKAPITYEKNKDSNGEKEPFITVSPKDCKFLEEDLY